MHPNPQRLALFISDLHLSDERPEMNTLFFQFLENIAIKAESLFILGDLFDYWVGDDQLDHDPIARQVADALKVLAQGGVNIFFMPGNRDFLIGQRFADETGLVILTDPNLVNLYGQQTLLMHGDTLCTDDVMYQKFRAQTRTGDWMNATLGRPYEARQQLAQSIRNQSDSAKSQKPEEIMDVAEATVQQAFRQHRYPLLIHGHTHRPATHQHVVDGHRCERWVLADWHRRGEYLEVSEHGVKRVGIRI